MEKTNFCISLFLLISTSLCNQVDYKYEEYKNDEYNYNEYYDYNNQEPEDYTDDYSQGLNDHYNQNLLVSPIPPPIPPMPLPTLPPTPPPMGKKTFSNLNMMKYRLFMLKSKQIKL